MDNRLSNFKMLQDVESLTNSEISSIADNMLKVGYAVISADWRSADRSFFSDFCLYTHAAQWFACQIVS